MCIQKKNMQWQLPLIKLHDDASLWTLSAWTHCEVLPFLALIVPDCLTLYLLCLLIYFLDLDYPVTLFALLTVFLTLACLLTLILDCNFGNSVC